VVVTLSATDGHAHQSAGDDLDRLSEDFVSGYVLIDTFVTCTVGSSSQETGRS
jgi:hypothetical protein